MSPPFAVWLLTALCAWESWAQCPTSQAWKNKSLHLDFTSIPNIFAFLFSKVLLLRVFRYFSETMLVQEYACSVVYFESTVWLRGGQGHVLRQSCRISQLSMTTWPILASWPVSKCRYSRLEHQDAQKFLVSFFCASVLKRQRALYVRWGWWYLNAAKVQVMLYITSIVRVDQKEQQLAVEGYYRTQCHGSFNLQV